MQAGLTGLLQLGMHLLKSWIMARMWCKVSFFKWSKTGLNSVFFLLGQLPNQQSQRTQPGGRTVEFMLSWRALALWEMQTASFRIGNWITYFISYITLNKLPHFYWVVRSILSGSLILSSMCQIKLFCREVGTSAFFVIVSKLN